MSRFYFSLRKLFSPARPVFAIRYWPTNLQSAMSAEEGIRPAPFLANDILTNPNDYNKIEPCQEKK